MSVLLSPSNVLLLTCSDYIARLPLRTEEGGRSGGGGGGGGGGGVVCSSGRGNEMEAKLQTYVTHSASLCDAIYSHKYNQVS